VPRRAGLHHVAQAVEHLAQRILPLCDALRQERQIRCNQRPFFIRYIRRIRLTGSHATQPDRYQSKDP
jgi:hypothetical protein